MSNEQHNAPAAALNKPASGDSATVVALNTSEGARRYVADFFERELRRHDFTRYITTTLAADFACALAQHLAATGKQQVGVPDGWKLVPIEPTWDMRNEGREFLIEGMEHQPERAAYFLWKTMVAAAPEVE